jgi:hypothetical protein
LVKELETRRDSGNGNKFKFNVHMIIIEHRKMRRAPEDKMLNATSARN